MRKENIPKILECYPNEYTGRYFDYRAKKTKGGYFKIYRRCFDGDDWRLYCRCVIVGGVLFTNWTGLMTTMEEELDKNGYFTEHPKGAEQFDTLHRR